MTTSSTSLLGLALPVTGELNGAWGDVVNNSLTSLLDTAIAGTTTLSADTDVTLSTTALLANQARQAVILCNGSRTTIRTITAPAQSKTYVIINATTGSPSPYAVKIVGAGPTTGVTIPAGKAYLVAWNGSDFVVTGTTTINLTTDVTGTLPVTNGGTGQTSYTDGQLLIGNSTGNTLTKATLTASTGISVTNGSGAITIANTAPDQTVSLTGGGGTTITGTYPNFTVSSTTYSTATTVTSGLIKLGDNTAQTTAANAVTSTASRSYALQLNASGQALVNVPWTDTTYSTATSSANGLIKLGSDTVQTTAANAVSSDASRTYAIQLNSSGQAVVNVPWATSSGTITGVTATSPVASSGGTAPVISLQNNYGDTQNPYASKTANFVLAAPNGSAGSPTFRALVASDIPTLNQNTNGTAACLSATLAVASGGTGATTAQGAMNTFAGATTAGSYLRGNGSNVVMSTIQASDVPTLNQSTSGTAANVTGVVAVANGGTGQTTYTDGQLLIGNSTGNTLTKATLTAGSGVTITNAGGSITISSTSSGGTVTGVTATSPVASSGGTAPVISLSSGYGDTLNPYASKTANVFLAAPNGSSGVPTFRAIVAADIPTLNQSTTGNALTATSANTATTATNVSGGTVNATTGTFSSTVRIENTAPVFIIQDTNNSGAGPGQVGYLSFQDSTNIERASFGYTSASSTNFDISNTKGIVTLNGSTGLTAANYNSYAPSLTGSGASGNWGISISGNALTATSSTKLATTNFTIEESGGKLIFKYGGTTIASMTSAGVFTALSDVAGGGTP